MCDSCPTTLAPAERVLNGAAFLDEQRPGWAALIDLEVLDIASGTLCVFGQVYGREAAGAGRCCGYHHGVKVLLGGDAERGKELGLLNGVDEDGVLEPLWKEAIAARV